MNPVLEDISLPAAKVLLALQTLCASQNSGTVRGVVYSTKEYLGRACKLYYPKLDGCLRELEDLGVLTQDMRGRFVLITPNRKWLVDVEEKARTVPRSGPKGVPNRTTPPFIRTVYNSTNSSNSATEKQGGVGGHNGTGRYSSSSMEVIALVDKALKRLGVPGAGCNSTYVKSVRSLASKRLNEGFKPEELMRVVAWAFVSFTQGNKFPAFKSFTYLWGKSFPERLAAAKSTGGSLTPEWLANRKATFVDPKVMPGGKDAGCVERDRPVPTEVKQPY